MATPPLPDQPPRRPAPARVRAGRLRGWNVAAAACLVIILGYMGVVALTLAAPTTEPQRPLMVAGLGLAPLVGLALAYWVVRTEVRRED